MSSPGTIIMAGQSKAVLFLLLGIFKSFCNLSDAYVEDQTQFKTIWRLYFIQGTLYKPFCSRQVEMLIS